MARESLDLRCGHSFGRSCKCRGGLVSVSELYTRVFGDHIVVFCHHGLTLEILQKELVYLRVIYLCLSFLAADGNRMRSISLLYWTIEKIDKVAKLSLHAVSLGLDLQASMCFCISRL